MRPFVKYTTFISTAAFLFINAVIAQKTDSDTNHGKTSLQEGVPIPVGQKGRGLTFPYAEDGKLKMFFNIDSVLRTDLNHLQMTNAKIQTFNDDGRIDMTLLLPVAVLDLTTRVLTSDQPFLVRRSDFSLVGEKLRLDTVARQGVVTGKVKVLIFNSSDSETKEPAHE